MWSRSQRTTDIYCSTFWVGDIPCTGIEPTASTALAARSKGIPIVEDFFGESLARELAGQGKHADLMIANNVLAHVPDVNDFVAGFTALLKPDGVASFEFPHLLKLIDDGQFDTIYHEHFSYLSLTSVDRILSANGLMYFDVEEHPTHGGSLRVLAQRIDTGQRPRDMSVDELLKREHDSGLDHRALLREFSGQDRQNQRRLSPLPARCKAAGHSPSRPTAPQPKAIP